jgi:hypothetical protein
MSYNSNAVYVKEEFEKALEAITIPQINAVHREAKYERPYGKDPKCVGFNVAVLPSGHNY